MSYITEVLVHGAHEKQIERVNAWLREHDTERAQQFQQINMDAAGGTKYFVSDVWAAAFNYMPTDLLSVLRDPATWKDAVLSVLVLIDGEEMQETILFGYVGREIVAASVYRGFEYELRITPGPEGVERG